VISFTLNPEFHEESSRQRERILATSRTRAEVHFTDQRQL